VHETDQKDTLSQSDLTSEALGVKRKFKLLIFDLPSAVAER